MPRRQSGARKNKCGDKTTDTGYTTSGSLPGSQCSVRKKEPTHSHRTKKEDLAGLPETSQEPTAISRNPSGSQRNVPEKKQADNALKLSSADEVARNEGQDAGQEMEDKKENLKKKKKRRTRQNRRAKAPESSQLQSRDTTMSQDISAPPHPRENESTQLVVPEQCSDGNAVDRRETTNMHAHSIPSFACSSTSTFMHAHDQPLNWRQRQASSDQDASHQRESGGRYVFIPEELTVQHAGYFISEHNHLAEQSFH